MHFFCVKSICPGFPGGSPFDFLSLQSTKFFLCLTKNYRRVLQHVHVFFPLVSYQTCVVLFLNFVETLCYGEVSLPSGMHWMLGGSVKSQTQIHTVHECIHTNVHAYILTYLQTHIVYIYIVYHPKTHTFSEFTDICDVLLFISMFKRLDFWSLINGKEFDYTGRVEFKESLVNKEELYQKKRCLVRVIKNPQ